jgi:hypothetical protein
MHGGLVQSAKAATLVCLTMTTGLGTWYLNAMVPQNEWRRAEIAGLESLGQERFVEAERHLTLAVYTARSFNDPDRRLGRSLFHLAQALVGQAKRAEALPLLQQSALIQSRALGNNHPDVVRVRAYQTTLLQDLDQLDQSNVDR